MKHGEPNPFHGAVEVSARDDGAIVARLAQMDR
jgi:hypothetical protein